MLTDNDPPMTVEPTCTFVLRRTPKDGTVYRCGLSFTNNAHLPHSDNNGPRFCKNDSCHEFTTEG